jgi:uncharacterized GH25 family protein
MGISMTRYFVTTIMAIVVATVAQAHFVFIIPTTNGTAAQIIFSDTLDPDESVEIGKIAGLKLTLRDVAGKDLQLTHTIAADSLNVVLPGSSPRMVFGSVEYGVVQRGDTPPFLLLYHTKAVLGDVPTKIITLGENIPAELVPHITDGQLRFKALAGGKPVVDTEVTVLSANGDRSKLKTNSEGMTPALSGVGRYGAWFRVSANAKGKFKGKKYEEVRHYATVVVDVVK